MNNDIAKEVLSKLFQQMVGEEIANLGFDYVNGTKSNLEPLRNILDSYQDDFTLVLSSKVTILALTHWLTT